MQLNKVLKGLLIAVPVLALTACGSTSNTDAGDANQNTGYNEQVQVESIEQVDSPEEMLRKKYEALRQEYTIYFDFDKSTVSPQFIELLQAHADFLVRNPSVKVVVEGHADERGTPEYNIALGERRAQSVSQYLQTLGVSASQLSIVSYGEEKPVDTTRTDEGFAKNRRAVLVY